MPEAEIIKNAVLLSRVNSYTFLTKVVISINRQLVIQ